MGLPGNEKVDRVAKQASLHPLSDTLSLPLQDLYPSVTLAIRESWHARWDTSRAADNKVALIKPTVERWGSSTQWTRHREVLLARLRIGHTRFTHGYLMTRFDPPPARYLPTALCSIRA